MGADFRQLRAALQGGGLSPQKSVVAGAAINTNIPVAGIRTGDVIVSAIMVQPPTAAAGDTLTDVTSEASITSDGNIQLTTTVSTGNQLLIDWWAVSR